MRYRIDRNTLTAWAIAVATAAAVHYHLIDVPAAAMDALWGAAAALPLERTSA